MPLSYLPFKSSARITKAAENNPPMRWGDKDQDVAVFQQALLDHGYTLPRSTKQGALDGIYGREMYDKVKYFQAQNNLGVDGIAGRQTFACLDHLLTTGQTAKPSKSVTLHFRSLCLTNVPFETQFRNAQRVYAQYNIEIRYGGGMSLNLSEAEAKKFEKIDAQCNWVVSDGEFAELQAIGADIPSSAVGVYYVNRFQDSTLLGCGGHMPNRPACFVAAKAGQWDMAHEVGHVLLTSSYSPVHHASLDNLMHPTAQTYKGLPTLDTAQLAQIRRSSLLR